MTLPAIFITGGTGFIGANLVAALNERDVVPLVLHRPGSSFAALEGLSFHSVIGDILDPIEELAGKMKGCRWLFHTAAVSDYWRQDMATLYRVNVEGTKNVIAAARLAGVEKMIFTSSLAALGVPEEGRALDENSTFNLPPSRFPYGHSKWLAEQEVFRATDGQLQTVVLNPTIVLGPRDVNAISGSLVLEVVRGRLRFCTTGIVNYVAVEDVAAGHLAAAEMGGAGERYILGGHNLHYCDAVRQIADVTGSSPPAVTFPGWIMPLAAAGVGVARAIFGNRIPLDANQVRLSAKDLRANSEKAKRELSLGQTPFRIAVQRTYDWYNSHGYFD